jgi:hypothetical protein
MKITIAFLGWFFLTVFEERLSVTISLLARGNVLRIQHGLDCCFRDAHAVIDSFRNRVNHEKMGKVAMRY